MSIRKYATEKPASHQLDRPSTQMSTALDENRYLGKNIAQHCVQKRGRLAVSLGNTYTHRKEVIKILPYNKLSPVPQKRKQMFFLRSCVFIKIIAITAALV